jgi:dihydroorotase
MNALLKSVTVVDSKSEFHNATVDILIENGIIAKISKRISNLNNLKEIRFENLHVSPGWFDSSVCFGEPGFEDRETLQNGIRTAALSGFTAVALNPNTSPVLDNSASIRFVMDQTHNQIVEVLPIGALTVKSQSVDLAELFDMRNAGAVAFSDYKTPVNNANLMKIALQYASDFDGLVYSYPVDSSLAGKGVMNEQVNSTRLGLKGIPNLAEEIRVARDLFLIEYAGGKLHIPTISTKKSVELIRSAKKRNIQVSCSVAIHNLVLTDDLLNEFDTNYKVLPPLRTEEDCNALIEGLKDGTIDLVTSDHNPVDFEHKNVEFDHAMFGTIGLETAFGVLNSIFSYKKTIALLTKGREMFGKKTSTIKVGLKADLSLFNPVGKQKFSKEQILSKSKNSCFLEYALHGKSYGVIANNKMLLRDE